MMQCNNDCIILITLILVKARDTPGRAGTAAIAALARGRPWLEMGLQAQAWFLKLRAVQPHPVFPARYHRGMQPHPSPLRSAIAAQLLGGGIVLGIALGFHPPLFETPLAAATLQGLLAAALSARLRAPAWWLPIHLAFLPAAVYAGRFGIAPAWYFAAFVLLLLIYWRTDRSRVPLYLSNAATARALAQLLPDTPCRVIDLGCGHGGLLRSLARARPDARFFGVEHAPLPWLWARLASPSLPNLGIRYGDFWNVPLDSYDVAYAFLSPVPMADVMRKACAEMRPGSLLVSNTFAVPDAQAERVVEVADRRATRLYCYRMEARGGMGCGSK